MANVVAREAQAAYDRVGAYNQDEINGFSDALIERMLALSDLSGARTVLDAMAGDANLSRRIVAYCRERSIPLPKITALEFSRVQAEFARARCAGMPVEVVWGDALSLRPRDGGDPLPEGAFDRILVKSANHEIPKERQVDLYRSLFRALAPGGFFVNLGFLMEDPAERDEFRSVARVKDEWAGMTEAVRNRHFLTRGEFYGWLEDAGFVDVRPGEPVTYTIRSDVVAREYFPSDVRLEADLAHQTAQIRALRMRRSGRIRFEGDRSIMVCPGEITLARKPTWTERHAGAFRACPYDFLRDLECHRDLLDRTVRAIPVGAAVLDVACGPGLLAERLVGRTSRYRGVDVEPSYLEKARGAVADAAGFVFDRADMQETDFGRGEWDAVTILNALFLAGIEPVRVLERVRDALKPGGVLVVSGPVSPESFRRSEPGIRKQLERDGLWERHRTQFEALKESNARILAAQGNYWSAEGMAALLGRLGFARVESVDTDLYYGFAYQVTARR